MIKLVCCGKMRMKWMKEGMQEYASRIRPYDKIEIIEVQDEKAPESNSAGEDEIVKTIEGQRLLKQIHPEDYVILLDLKGKECDSVELSEKLENLYTYSHNRIVFVIGGSLGLSKEVIARADFRWKLSVNTFPHQLCRIIVLEQIYRAFRILHHEPYHK